MIKLGSKVRDSITGLEGTVIARTEYLYGSTSVGVEPPLDKDGKIQKVAWFDEPRAVEIGSPQ